jgi:hypothetical protein
MPGGEPPIATHIWRVERCQSSLGYGLPAVHFHDLRHTGNNLTEDLHVPARDAQAILGHSRVSTTLEIYTNVDEQARRDALNRLHGLLDEARADRCYRRWLLRLRRVQGGLSLRKLRILGLDHLTQPRWPPAAPLPARRNSPTRFRRLIGDKSP